MKRAQQGFLLFHIPGCGASASSAAEGEIGAVRGLNPNLLQEQSGRGGDAHPLVGVRVTL